MKVALTPIEFANRARRLYANNEAVVDGALRLTYKEFFNRCDRWSFALQKMGVKAADRVAYIAPNTHSHLEAYYSVPQIGAVLVPINYRLSPDEFEYIINHSGAKVLCVHPDYFDLIDSIKSKLSHVQNFIALEGDKVGWSNYEKILTESDEEFHPAEIDEDDLITINYTSGTTARPKGVMITHRNAYMNIMGTLVHHHLTPADRYLWTLPMFHANGWTFTWINTARGMAHICLRKVEPTLIYELIQNENITMFCAAPTVLISITNASPELRAKAPRGVRLFTAGAPPAAATIEIVERDLGWELTHVYGLTETTPLIAVCEPRALHMDLSIEERAKIKARQGIELVSSGELKVVDENGVEVAKNGETLGEIAVRGNVVMKGYYNDPISTDAAIRDGWFYTGDAAVVHDDGYLEIRDRFKDVIISGGENISSVEVEGCLLHHPAILEVAVVGMPHEKWGEAPHAFVVLQSGQSCTKDQLRRHVRENLAHFKTPQWFSFVEDLPKTATGKVQKFVLRDGKAGISAQ